jgi:hypothetical protein
VTGTGERKRPAVREDAGKEGAGKEGAGKEGEAKERGGKSGVALAKETPVGNDIDTAGASILP